MFYGFITVAEVDEVGEKQSGGTTMVYAHCQRHFWTSPSNLSASLMEMFTGRKQNSQFWDHRAHVLDYQDFQIIGQWIKRQGRHLRVASGATAPGPTLEGAPHFRPMRLSSYILR